MNKQFITLASTIIMGFALISCDNNVDNPVYPIDDSEIIQFKDSYAEAVLVQFFDKNGDFKLSKKEAEHVIILGNIFSQDNNLTSMDELKYFTGLRQIRDGEFWDNHNLKSIVIPSSVKTIGNSFPNCYSLESVTFSEGLEEIGTAAFGTCTSLKSISIPRTVKKIDGWAFYNTPSVKSISVDPGNTVYDSRNNCNCIIETSTNTVLYGCSKSTIPSGVLAIDGFAFYNSNIEKIVIPETVEKIWGDAFEGCTKLKEMIVKPTTPPQASDIFGYDDEVNEDLKIYVPSESVDAYKTSEGWSDLSSRIFPIE